MAEPFSIVSGALGIAALFTNCVTCFDYIQLGRHFAEDYQQCQIMLDTLSLRLSRWGDAVGIYDKPCFRNDQTNDPHVQQAGTILAQIEQLFVRYEASAKQYSLGKQRKQLEVLDVEDLEVVNCNVHNKLLNANTRYRQKCTSIFKRTKWALYDNKNFEKLVRHVAELTEQLEKLWPQDQLERVLMDMARMEIEDITDAPSLEVLSEAARDVDSILSQSAAQKLQTLETHNEVNNACTEGDAKVHVGDWMGARAEINRNLGISSTTWNTVGSLAAKGGSKVQVGNRFGGDPLF
ncbi:heterokaryon incompatibility protein s [Xylariaceae sp. FL1272]|nr:heterokaryon incompatibility protein s [Xylariaceae sp. FL1272]